MVDMTVPDWSPIRDPRAFDAFIAMMRDAIGATGLPWAGEPEMDTWMLMADDVNLNLSLRNVAAGCAHAEQAQWSQLIARFVAETVDVSGMAAAEQLFADADQVRPLLRTRIVHMSSFHDNAQSRSPYRRISRTLAETVVVDQPTSMMYLPATQFASIGLSPDDALAAGRENLLAKTPKPSVQDLLRADGLPPLWLLEDHSGYGAAWTLQLSDVLVLPPAGAIVTVPTRTHAFVVPLRSAKATVVLSQLMEETTGLYGTGAYPLSSDALWFRDGSLTALTDRESDPSVGLRDTGGLSAALMHLPAEEPTTATEAGRNDPCPCGSGRKFKRCHGR